MFTNGTFDLRVDLLALGKFDFPKLTETIGKYASKIEEILKSGKRN
jgi:hypothetical protein